MADRGYEPQDYQQRVADLSVEHAGTLEHYRTAHDISARAANKEASTEELRQAIVDYRTLLEDLLEAGTGGTAEVAPQTEGEPQRRTAAGDASVP
ncbi:MAG: putative secreted protein [Actinomycetia bacterium]|nr:putative secreted protein [Actinomycetes bacterium]